MIDRKYSIIYADPPWLFRVWSDKGDNRCASYYYPTMNIEDIKNIDVKSISEKDSILMLWCISSMIPEALDVIKAWGFEYKTVGLCWVKPNRNNAEFFMGLGYYTRQNMEMCLIARRGKGLQRASRTVRQVISSPKQSHSKKPDEARDRIVQLFGDVSRIELFARERVNGWDSVGFDIDGKDIRDVIGIKEVSK